MSGGSKTTGTQTATKSQPMMNDVLGSAKTIFNKGTAWAPNTTSMVTPFSTQTRQGLAGMQNTATGATPAFDANFGRVNSTLQDGGLNDLQDQQVGRLQNQASGGMLQNNPYLNEVINRTGDDIRYQSGLNASAMGRYGSGGHEGVLADKIGDMSSNLRYQDYGRERGYMQDAIGSLFNAGSLQRDNQLGGAAALQNAYQAQLSPYQTMTGVGGQYENKNQQVLQDQARVFQERKNQQTDPVNWLANLANSFQGGQQVSSVQQPYSPIGSALGGGLSAYGATGNPFLGLLGGVGGLL